MNLLPPQDIALIEEAKGIRGKEYAPPGVQDLLSIITKLQAALEFIMQQEAALSDHGKDKVKAILNGDVK